MTNKTKIILSITVVFAIFIIGLLIFYSYTIKSDNQIDDVEEFTDTYIFGRPTDKIIGNLSTTFDEFIDLDKEADIPRLRKITEFPVAGFTLYKDDKDIASVRYTERSTGHIYETKVDSLSQKRVSNTTIPRVQESIWVDEDSTVIRYLDENDNIKSFYAQIVKNEKEDPSENQVEGVFLADNMKEVIPLGNRLFYLMENFNGSQGFTSNLDGEGVVRVFNSPLKEWIVKRPKQGILTLTTKPSSDVFGYLYFLDINSEKMDKKLTGKGLVTLANKNLSSVLFSKNSSGNFSLNIYDVLGDEEKPMFFSTFPEKCVWSKDNVNVYCGIPELAERANYPDDWYQGTISFTDSIWRLNVKKNEDSELIVFPEDMTREAVDIIKPVLDFDEEYLFFINKKDLALWSFKLK